VSWHWLIWLLYFNIGSLGHPSTSIESPIHAKDEVPSGTTTTSEESKRSRGKAYSKRDRSSPKASTSSRTSRPKKTRTEPHPDRNIPDEGQSNIPEQQEETSAETNEKDQQSKN